ncbi:MAG TPA: hypothetical protein VGP48_02675 [Stellaceae bacterium]|jgi:hypothetical protein|nr:hypothetical protein [Stellaceae bacterium]
MASLEHLHDSGDLGLRARILSSIVEGTDVAVNFPLVKGIRVPDALFARLEQSVITYIWHTLSQALPGEFTPSRQILADYASAIPTLPNRTPNGVLLARRETFLSFNLIHQALAQIFEALGLLRRLSFVQSPCNVRIVSGAASPAAEGRPYASTKIHTDVWAGEPTNTLLFNIPVLGDMQAVDLRFFEPRAFPERLRVRLDDYDLGRPVVENAVAYPATLRAGEIYLSDALCLHQTVKRSPGLRLSLDFRAIFGEQESVASGSGAVYVPVRDWCGVGSTTILASGTPLDAWLRRAAGEVVSPSALSIALLD